MWVQTHILFYFKSLVNLLQCFLPFVYVLFFFFFVCETCGLLVPRPRIEPTFLALEGKIFTTGPPGKFTNTYFNIAHIMSGFYPN